MASYTVRKVVEDVRLMVDDYVDYNVSSNDLVDGNSYTNQSVLDAINFAIKEYCRGSNASFAFHTATVPATGLIPVPTDYLDIKQVGIDGKLLEKSSYSFESMKDYDWETETASAARRWMLQDFSLIRATPIVTEWNAGTHTAKIGYLQAPKPVTTISTVAAGSFVIGKWYQINTVGDTSFTGIGAASNTVGAQFKALGAGSGSGTAYEVIDQRVIEAHQDYLKYAASYFLLTLEGSSDSVAKADKYLNTFKYLVSMGA